MTIVELHIVCRRFASVAAARRAYEELSGRLAVQAQAGSIASLSAALACDADSAAAMITLYGPVRAEVEQEAERVGGTALAIEELPPDYLQGLRARRARAIGGLPTAGAVRTDYPAPSVLEADGRVRRWH